MQNFIVIACCVLSVVAFAKGNFGNNTELLEDLTKCGEKAGISDDDMEKIVAHKLPETKNGMCTMACFMKKHNMMTEENAMNEEGIKTFTKKVMPNEDELSEELSTAIEACSKELTAEISDECEAAKKIIDCVMPKIHKHMEKKLAE